MENNNWTEKSQQAFDGLEALLKNPKWAEFNKTPECKMYQLALQNRVASLGETEINVPFEKVVEFLKNPSCIDHIDLMLERSEVLFQEKQLDIQYLKYKGVFPASARDFVILTVHKATSETRHIFASTSVVYKKAEESGTVRATVICAGYEVVKVGENKTKVTYISDADPEGSLPGFIKTMVSKGQTQVALNLKRYLEKNQK